MIVIIIIRPTSFDSVDLELDSVISINEKYSGSEQSFQKWLISHQVDQQPAIVYQFSSIFPLQSRQIICILSKRNLNAARLTGDTLIADSNEEKTIITEIFQ
ncbi:unnamed protein product [Adineta steineri]|uniref:Uncharacterized protein n=1 Tax=Adineta steineri TaxID=433720 RepID=A0A819P265_9BILA|nr:unnamed protein product [Adineta steineri]CAF4006018.1 unnamed protein product [Adineta steineri]